MHFNKTQNKFIQNTFLSSPFRFFLMNLIIDIGNTRAKLAVFKNNQLLKTAVCHKEELKKTEEALLNEFPLIADGIIANVASPEETYKKVFATLQGLQINLSSKTPVPFINSYHSQDTLGLDRIALAAAAVTQFPGKDTLVIDTGTCITYDIITANNNYLGGAISPGVNMRYRSLNNFTANLPLLRAKHTTLKKIGQTTKEGLRLGVMQGTIFEIEGFIAHFEKDFPNLTTVLTGGDAKILSKSLKTPYLFPKISF